jgi:hypothetical protein
MIECLSLNHVNLYLQSIIPAIIDCFRLLLEEIVDYLCQALLSDSLHKVSELCFLGKRNVLLRIVTEIFIFILLCARASMPRGVTLAFGF